MEFRDVRALLRDSTFFTGLVYGTQKTWPWRGLNHYQKYTTLYERMHKQCFTYWLYGTQKNTTLYERMHKQCFTYRLAKSGLLADFNDHASTVQNFFLFHGVDRISIAINCCSIAVIFFFHNYRTHASHL